MAPDFIRLCRELDDFMMSFPDVDKALYKGYGEHENIHNAFIAYLDDIPVGCAAFREQSKWDAELKRVYVKEPYRNLGISRKLLCAVEESVRKEGFRTLTLATLLSLEGAVHLYQTSGFSIVAVEGLYIHMQKVMNEY
jgi:GNAT superfamily N-acetyltransferase